MVKLIVAAIVLLGLSGSAAAADPAAGKTKFGLCAGCHGPSGAGNEALKYPKLSGLEAGYIAQQLRAFKSGTRDNATMRAMTASLTETDMDNLAAYVASLK